MLLNELIKNAPEIEISQLSCDSRLPMKDSIFFCLKGVKYNGHEYVEEAVNNGARVIIYSEDIDTSLNAIYIRVADVNDILAKISNIFYDNPSSKLETYLTAGSYGLLFQRLSIFLSTTIKSAVISATVESDIRIIPLFLQSLLCQPLIIRNFCVNWLKMV